MGLMDGYLKYGFDILSRVSQDVLSRFGRLMATSALADVGQRLDALVKRSESPVAFAWMSGAVMAGLFLAHLPNPASFFTAEPESGPSDILEKALVTQPEMTADAKRQNMAVAPEENATKGTLAVTERPTETYTLKRRETLGALLKRAKINNRNAHKAIQALSAVANMRTLKAGTRFTLAREHDQPTQLHSLGFRQAFDEEAQIEWVEDHFESQKRAVGLSYRERYVGGIITDSLYLSAKRAGAPDAVLQELIRLMSFDVDFQRDIWKDDQFALYFEEATADKYGDSAVTRLTFARLTLHDRPIEATYYVDSKGKSGYFDADGSSTQKALMKTPVNGARLSSGFGRRKHPILGYTRVHKGLDFAAPRGTPIMAAGDGIVERANRYGAYGNYIRIRHGSGYKTAYAHLQGFAKNIGKGKRVTQGQVIGYIGSTGRSTGPHLHYEILQGDRQINPNKLKLPDARTLDGAELARFQTERQTLLTKIDAEQVPAYAEAATPQNATALRDVTATDR